ncbi:hypothetical protein V757_00345 [Pelistega indica]|uniref:Terminase n=1 Tax=Pelistega indica TaxID=1414851 RepID=V8G9L1_9BURK|nr:hypothetical protein [Pelistega indica]ETD73090.1 hypothetical protein V757_00345 [Pelistega indica]
MELSYKPTPTILKMHNSTKPDKAIAGPPGGGKTVGALWECIFRAMRQPPDANNRRKFRVVIIRATYPNLKLTTLKTIRDWLPRELGDITLTQPMEGTLTWQQADGTWVDFELIFLAVEDEAEIDKMRSMEMSVIWINEATEVTRDVYEMAQQRVGRYPAAKDGAICAEPGVIMDFNLPGVDHWLYDVTVRNVPATLDFFMQPPAVICTNFEKADAGEEPPQFVMNDEAENLDNLPAGYYEKQLANASSWNRIKSFLLMKWASFNIGKIVFDTFSRTLHVASVYTEPLPFTPVYVGIDTSGLHPGAVFAQLQMGSLVILAEVYGEDTAFLEFIDKGLKPIIAEKFGQHQLLAICDPANPRDAFTGQTPVQALQRAGIKAITAYTNKFKPRREAVAAFLNRRAGMAIDRRCVTLIQALEEKYVFRKLRIASTSGAQYANEPEKNAWSHVVDALQYLCLYLQMPNGPVENQTTGDNYKGRVRPRRLL